LPHIQDLLCGSIDSHKPFIEDFQNSLQVIDPSGCKDVVKRFPFDNGFASQVSATSIALGALEVGLIHADRSYPTGDLMPNRCSGCMIPAIWETGAQVESKRGDLTDALFV
jgi:hypothetical protein